MRARSLEVLKRSAGFGRDCSTLKMVESVHISHALFALGKPSLALKWINESMEGMTDSFATGSKRAAEVVWQVRS